MEESTTIDKALKGKVTASQEEEALNVVQTRASSLIEPIMPQIDEELDR